MRSQVQHRKATEQLCPVRRPSRRAGRRPSTGASGPIRRALGPGLISQLEELCDGHGLGVGLLDVASDLAAIGIAATVGVLLRFPLASVAAILYIGIRQRHLSNLAHECVHGKIVRSPAANKVLGYFLMTILGEDFSAYRASHQIHHARLGLAGDPMLQSYVSREALIAAPSRRGFVLRVIILKAIWTLPVSALVTFFSKAETESRGSAIGRAVFWITFAGSLTWLGWLGQLVQYWLLPLIFVRPVITWITDLGNHAGVIDSGDPITQTRGWTSHWLTRHLLGGHLDDMFHPVHHWCPRIPWRQLPRAAAILQEQYDRWSEVPWCSGYFFRRGSTPGVPCVVEDIVNQLRDNYSRPLSRQMPSLAKFDVR